MKNHSQLSSGYRYVMLLFFLSYLSSSLYASDKSPLIVQPKFFEIRGIITDAQGPLPGVTIYIQSTKKATQSDLYGNYKIKVQSGDLLVFSFIGFTDQKIKVVNQQVLNVQMIEDSKKLNEIIVNAGYYTVKDKERTGSIARVTSTQIENKSSNTILDALQGQAAGVQIIQKSGLAGGGFQMQIRGQNSLRDDGNSPLYILDGMPLSNSKIENNDFNRTMPFNTSNPLSLINLNDIQSIEVLKDADATAIYGSRGANGVVLITTKKSNQVGTYFQINSFTGFGNITKKMNLLSTAQFIEMKKEGYANDGITTYPSYEHALNGNWDQTRYTDWQDKLIGNTMQFQHIDFGVRGGYDQTSFSLNVSNHQQGTVFVGNQKQNLLSFQSTVKHHSKNNLFNLDFNVGYNESTNNLTGLDFSNLAISLAPNAPRLYNDDGTLNWENSTWENPLRDLENSYQAKNTLLSSSAQIRYQLIKNLEFKTQLGFSKNTINQTRLASSTYYNPAFGLDSKSSDIMTNKGESINWNVEPQVSYSLTVGKQSINLLAGLTFLNIESTRLGLMGQGFSTNSLLSNIKAAEKISIIEYYNPQYKYNAGFARINYNLDNKYIINLTGRRDGSSRFGDNFRFANFGAIGLAWLFSNEKWFKNNSWFTFGKLRGSYGTTGSDQIGDYQYLDTYSSTGSLYDDLIGLKADRLYNPNFSWEKTTKLEGALELSFLQDRISTSIAYYKNRSSNQLVGNPLPGTTGFSTIQANFDATVENTGWEFTLNSNIISNQNWRWSTNFNLSIPRNKLVSFPNLEGSTYANQYVVGESLSVLKLYHYLGVDSQSGLYAFEDYTQDNKFDQDDQKILLNTSPKWYGGLTNSISYKNWDLSMLLYFVNQKGTNYKARGITGSSNNITSILDRWQKPGDQKPIQMYTSGGNPKAVQANNLMKLSDGIYTNTSFVRLKNVQLSYNITPLKKIQCKVYLMAENLFTLSSYKDTDPETQFSGYLPPLRQFTFGTQINF